MYIAIYKNLKKDFDELERLLKKHHIDPETYVIRSVSGEFDDRKATMYICNGQIVVVEKDKDSSQRTEREYEVDAKHKAFKDFINIVVSDKKKQKRILDEYQELDNCESKICESVYFSTLEEHDARKKYPVPFFIEGHDSGESFWIRPVRIKTDTDIGINVNDVEEFDDEISVPACFVDDVLYQTFIDFFDENMDINRKRVEYSEVDKETNEKIVKYAQGFEYYLTYNFFTYDQMSFLLDRLQKCGDLLEKGKWGIIDKDSREIIEASYELDCDEDTKASFYRWIGIFYKGLAERIRRMMVDNPETVIISVMGP